MVSGQWPVVSGQWSVSSSVRFSDSCHSEPCAELDSVLIQNLRILENLIGDPSQKSEVRSR